MRLLRQQESTPFLTAEEGRKRRFFQNFPCRLHRIVLQFSCLRIWATQFSLTLVIKNGYNKKVGIGAEKWPSGRRRLTRNQLSGLPFREFESHLLRHFYFHENLTKSKTPLMSGVFAFLLSDAIDRNVPV